MALVEQSTIMNSRIYQQFIKMNKNIEPTNIDNLAKEFMSNCNLIETEFNYFISEANKRSRQCFNTLPEKFFKTDLKNAHDATINGTLYNTDYYDHYFCLDFKNLHSISSASKSSNHSNKIISMNKLKNSHNESQNPNSNIIPNKPVSVKTYPKIKNKPPRSLKKEEKFGVMFYSQDGSPLIVNENQIKTKIEL